MPEVLVMLTCHSVHMTKDLRVLCCVSLPSSRYPVGQAVGCCASNPVKHDVDCVLHRIALPSPQASLAC
jgi:hypothetical protein